MYETLCLSDASSVSISVHQNPFAEDKTLRVSLCHGSPALVTIPKCIRRDKYYVDRYVGLVDVIMVYDGRKCCLPITNVTNP